MAKEAVFTMKLEPELRDAFMAAAKRSDQSASQVMRKLMRDFIEKLEADPGYTEFYREKVAIAEAERAAGLGIPGDDVEAFFVERRREWRRRAKDAA